MLSSRFEIKVISDGRTVKQSLAYNRSRVCQQEQAQQT